MSAHKVKTLIHPECQKRLLESVTTALPDVRVSHGYFIDYSTIGKLQEVDKIIPTKNNKSKSDASKPRGEKKTKSKKGENVADLLDEFIDDMPVYTFVIDQLSRILIKENDYDDSDEKPRFIDVIHTENPNEIALKIVDNFANLPYDYAITFPIDVDIANALLLNQNVINITYWLRIVRITESISSEFPLLSESERFNHFINPSLLGIMPDPKLPIGSTFIQLFLPGYVAIYGMTVFQHNISEKIKAFFGLLIAFNAVVRTYKSESLFQNLLSTYFHEKKKDKFIIDSRNFINRSTSLVIRTLTINPELRSGSEHAAELRLRTLNAIMAVMQAHDSLSEKIVRGASWLLDSFGGDDELLSFVQAMVALEIILGDKATSDAIGLGELLRNRCAYLIGRSENERRRILDEFSELYEVRSAIVHRGKSRFTARERYLLRRLQMICARVIQEETRLLASNFEAIGKVETIITG